MNISSKALAPLVLVSFVVGIGLTMAFNLWRTESSKQPALYQTGEFAGESNPADIRGSYSFDDIEAAFDVPVEVLAQAFGATDRDNPGAFQAKELEEIYAALPDGGEVGTDAVRLFVALYTLKPYTPEETTVLPAPALSFLKDKLASADYELLRERSVQLSEILSDGETSTVQEHEESEEREIKGNTTFDELLGWGLSKEEVEAILGMEMGPRSSSIRDFLIEKDLEFSEYKEQLQALLDSKS